MSVVNGLGATVARLFYRDGDTDVSVSLSRYRRAARRS